MSDGHNEANVNTVGSHYKALGFYIRCVARHGRIVGFGGFYPFML